MVGRLRALGMSALLLVGCFSRLDEDRLLHGADAAVDGATSAPRCVVLDGLAPGSIPPGMQVEAGAWQVELDPGAGKNALAQKSAPSGDTIYRILTDDPDTADVSIAATLLVAEDMPMNPLHQCVLARYLDKDNFYWFGLDSLAARWQLKVKVAGNTNALMSGDFDAPLGSRHRLELSARGTSFELRIDGTVVGTAEDASLTHGRVGVGSGTTTSYTDICVTALSSM